MIDLDRVASYVSPGPEATPKPQLREADGLWVFGYGSLMWNPGFAYVERHPALLRGYHRRFCVYSVHYRGTPRAPGLVLGLDRGGACHGIVFRVPPGQVGAALDYLWQRELITDIYTPRFVRLQTPRGRVSACCFVVRRNHPHYHAPRDPHLTADLIRRAAGDNGSNRRYLENTLGHLADLGLRDRGLEQLARRVAELDGRNHPSRSRNSSSTAR